MGVGFRAVVALALDGVSLASFAARHEVKMLNQGEDGVMVFEPGYLRAEVGDTVTFVPTDPAHNSVSDAIPNGARAWNGALNETVTVTLEKEGIYLYKCTPHLPLGMVGVIQVGKPVNMDNVRLAADALSAGIAANKERLQKYLGQVQ